MFVTTSGLNDSVISEAERSIVPDLLSCPSCPGPGYNLLPWRTSAKKLLAALELQEIGERFALIFEPLLKGHLDPLSSQLSGTIQALSSKVTTLEAEGKVKDAKIATLEKRITQMETTLDDLERHGRRESMRIFRLPETDPGTTDEKVLKLVNQRMKLYPPLQLEEIAVSHRVGPQQPEHVPEDTDAPLPGPRPLLVKFVSRRSKERVMAKRKNLRNQNPGELRPGRENGEAQGEDHTDTVNGDTEQELPKVYITDDLTKARASLAYQARVLKRSKRILDTWVINCKVMIKKCHGHISQVKSSRDLQNL